MEKVRVASILLGYLFVGCAYFNTFYNATQFFQIAQSEINTRVDADLSENTIDLLNKTIIRCNTVLKDYTESRFRDDAFLLRSKAQYHLGLVSAAIVSIKAMEAEFPESPLIKEAKIWKIKYEWKNGLDGEDALSQAIEYVTSLGEDDRWGKVRRLKRLAYQTISDIYQEKGNVDSSLTYLERAAEMAINRGEKMSAHFLIAEKAYKEKRLPVALQNYRKVVTSHPDPDHVETAHLQIVRIYREMENWDAASREIETLTTSEKFLRIKSDLNLELAKLYEMQSRSDEARQRYELITEEFPKTRASAESYFKLGSFTLQKNKDYLLARKYFDNVAKEYRESTYAPSAMVRVQEIDDLLINTKAIKEFDEKLFGITKEQLKLVSPDTLINIDESNLLVSNISDSALILSSDINFDSTLLYDEMAGHLYSAGELESFRFGHIEAGMKYFQRIIEELPSTTRTAQAIYSLIYLNEAHGDPEHAKVLRRVLLESYPESEYAHDLDQKNKKILSDIPAKMMVLSESLIQANPDSAIAYYKKILIQYPNTRYAPIVLLSIAHIYDRRLNKLPEARKTYERIVLSHSKTDQADLATKRIAQFDKIIDSIPDSSLIQLIEKDDN